MRRQNIQRSITEDVSNACSRGSKQVFEDIQSHGKKTEKSTE